jgi:membrane-associated phospholipid phosphatase
MCGMLSERKREAPAWIFAAGFGLGLLICVFNRQIFFLINGPDTPYLDWIMLSLTHLGNGMAAAMLASLLAPLRRDLTIRAALAMIIAGTVTSILKDHITSLRPPAVFGDSVYVLGPKLMRSSLPSGHTATAFALACSLAGSVRPWIFRGALALAVLVGISRIYIGAHFPVDVVLGALIGWLCAMGVRRPAAWVTGHLEGDRPVLDTFFLLLAVLGGIYLAFFEPMVRFNPWFLRPFGLTGIAVAVFMFIRGLSKKGERM